MERSPDPSHYTTEYMYRVKRKNLGRLWPALYTELQGDFYMLHVQLISGNSGHFILSGPFTYSELRKGIWLTGRLWYTQKVKHILYLQGLTDNIECKKLPSLGML